MEKQMTHKELVTLAVKQLKKWRCKPICSEMMFASHTCEIPDAIGWTSRASIMFECKTSRADFLRDNYGDHHGLQEHLAPILQANQHG